MNREDEQQIAAAEREEEMARLFAIGDQAPKPEDRVMRRTLIVSAVMLSLLTMLAPPASASDTVGCQKQTSHRAVCWNYKRYAVFFKAELRFRDGTWRTYWFKLNSNEGGGSTRRWQSSRCRGTRGVCETRSAPTRPVHD